MASKRGAAGAESLDRSGDTPLYVQIVQLLRAEILGARLAPGTALPSEAALCKRFGVARSVIRQALAVLVSEGVVHREPGRAPLVAARNEHRRMIQRSTGLFDQFADKGALLRTRVTRLDTAAPPPEVAAFFASEDTWLLERVRRVDDAPLAFVRTWLPRSLVPRLEAGQLADASLHQVMATLYGLRPGRGRHRIRAVAADKLLAEMLDTLPGSPLLQLEGQGLDNSGRPLEWFTTWHRADQLVFEVEVGPAGEHVQPVMESAETMSGEATPADGHHDKKSALAEAEQALVAALEALQRLRQED